MWVVISGTEDDETFPFGPNGLIIMMDGESVAGGAILYQRGQRGYHKQLSYIISPSIQAWYNDKHVQVTKYVQSKLSESTK